MLKKLWTTLFPPPGPPWIDVRQVNENEPEYRELSARLEDAGPPAGTGAARSALQTLRDRETGQLWDVFIVDDSPAPLYGLVPREPLKR